MKYLKAGIKFFVALQVVCSGGVLSWASTGDSGDVGDFNSTLQSANDGVTAATDKANGSQESQQYCIGGKTKPAAVFSKTVNESLATLRAAGIKITPGPCPANQQVAQGFVNSDESRVIHIDPLGGSSKGIDSVEVWDAEGNTTWEGRVNHATGELMP